MDDVKGLKEGVGDDVHVERDEKELRAEDAATDQKGDI